jgi:hypothetical protein
MLTAVWNGPAKNINTTWSAPLVPGSLNVGNWLAYSNGGLPRSPLTAVAAGAAIQLHFASGPLPPHLSYDPPPFDVLQLSDGTAAKAFQRFPVT